MGKGDGISHWKVDVKLLSSHTTTRTTPTVLGPDGCAAGLKEKKGFNLSASLLLVNSPLPCRVSLTPAGRRGGEIKSPTCSRAERGRKKKGLLPPFFIRPVFQSETRRCLSLYPNTRLSKKVEGESPRKFPKERLFLQKSKLGTCKAKKTPKAATAYLQDVFYAASGKKNSMNIPSQFLKMVLFHARKTLSPFFCPERKRSLFILLSHFGFVSPRFFCIYPPGKSGERKGKRGTLLLSRFFCAKKVRILDVGSVPLRPGYLGKGGGGGMRRKKGGGKPWTKKSKKIEGKVCQCWQRKKCSGLKFRGCFFLKERGLSRARKYFRGMFCFLHG